MNRNPNLTFFTRVFGGVFSLCFLWLAMGTGDYLIAGEVGSFVAMLVSSALLSAVVAIVVSGLVCLIGAVIVLIRSALGWDRPSVPAEEPKPERPRKRTGRAVKRRE